MSRNTLVRRTIGAAAAVAVAIGGLIVGAAPAHADFTSSIDGLITRSEVIERAQYWVDHQPGLYSQTAFSPDPTGSRNYRRDYSGYVDMAWHVGTDYTTHNIDQVSTVISRSDLQPGDVLNDADDHVILFAGWEADHEHFSFYSFGATPVKLETHQDINQAAFDTHANSLYVARRYIHIIDDPAPAPDAESSGSVVFNGVMYEFARGADGTVKYWWANGGAWSSVQTFGSGIASDPVATVFNGNLYVYAIGTDSQIHYWWASGGAWSSVQTVGGPASGALSATVFNGVMYVFARGTDGTVKYWWASGGAWSSVQTIGGPVSGAVSSTVFNGIIYAYARGTDGTVKYWWANGGPWSSQQTFGTGLA